MKAMIHKLSKAQSKVIAAFLAIVMIFGVFAFIAPVEAQAVEIDATDAGFYNVSDGTDGATSFVEGSQIRVENTLRTSKNTGLYTLTDSGWTTTDNLVWNSAAENQFKAWYPATDYASFDTFELPTVQNTNALLAAADWMTASTEEMAKPSDKTLELNFQHLLAKVTINVNSWGNEYEDTAKSINDVKIYTLATDIVKNDAGEAVYNSISLTGIDPLVEDQAYTAIICPGAYTSGQEIMTFTVNDTDNLIVRAGNNTELTTGLEAGKHYEFNLTVGKDRVALDTVSVSDWADGGIIDGGVAEEVDYNYNEATNTYTVYTADALTTAIANAQVSGTAENPAKIKLMQNVEPDADTEYSLMIKEGVVILDLNGYKINSADNTAIYVAEGATLTVCDSGTGGAIIANTTGIKSDEVITVNTTGIKSDGTLTVTGGMITADTTSIEGDHAITVNTIGIESNGTLTVTGGTITANTTDIKSNGELIYDGTGFVNDGLITVNNTGIKSNGKLTVTGGTFTADTTGIESNGELIVTGGTITADITGIESNGTLTVTGGTITADTFGIKNNNVLTISGGTVISKNHVAIMDGTVILSGAPTLECGELACDIALATIKVEGNLEDVKYTYFDSTIEGGESRNFELFEGYSISSDKTKFEKYN